MLFKDILEKNNNDSITKNQKDNLKIDLFKIDKESLNKPNKVGNCSKTGHNGLNIYGINAKAPTFRSNNGASIKVAYKEEGNLKIRSITPRESWRLMGWKDEQIDRVIHLPKTNLYFTAGNSMVVDVMQAITKELLK